MPEPTSAHLPERDAAGGDDRTYCDRRFVTDSSGRVLVHDPPAECGPELECVARADHRVGQRERFGARQALEVHRHAPRGHLVVGHLVTRIGEDELGELVSGEFLPVAFAFDQIRRSHHPHF